MSHPYKPGARLFGAACTTELIVVKTVNDLDLTVGGLAPVEKADERGAGAVVVDGFGGGTQVGKRYVDDAGTVELLCTKAGDGVPAVGGVVLSLKAATPLPASD